MKLLINISNNIGGGSFQVAHSFIQECKKHTENDYIVAINSRVYHLFDIESFPSNFKFLCIEGGSFLTLAKKMKVIEKKFNPEIVFTVFGPAYWRPNVPHVVGFANPYYISMNNKVADSLKKVFTKKQYLAIRLKKILHTFYMNRDADSLIAETQYCTDGFLKIFKKVKQGYTVSNTCNSFFDSFVEPIGHENFTLLTVCKYYKHKNLEIINKVCKELSSRKITDVKFILTLDNEIFEKLFKDNSYVINAGYTAPKDCPNLYAKADAMFLPTLAECFSASYPEAMKSQIPILTSDFEFAHSICNDAAIYFNPFNASEIAEKIVSLKNDKGLCDSLVKKGKTRLKNFPSAPNRCEEYLRICKETMEAYR